jgi:hypothetical protein
MRLRINGMARFHQLSHFLALIDAAQQGTLIISGNAFDQRIQIASEPNDKRLLFEDFSRWRMNKGPAACRQNKGRRLIQKTLNNAKFPIAKICLAVIAEITGYCASGCLFNRIIAIIEWPPKPFGQASSDGCLPYAHKANKGDGLLDVQRHERAFICLWQGKWSFI